MVAPVAKRQAVAHLKAHPGLSERRTWQIAGAGRKLVRYQSQRTPDTALRGGYEIWAMRGGGSVTSGCLCGLALTLPPRFDPTRVLSMKVLDGTGMKPMARVGKKGLDRNAIAGSLDQANIIPT